MKVEYFKNYGFMNVPFKNCRTAHRQMEYPYILALRGKEIKIYKYIFKLWFGQMNIEEYYFIPIVCIKMNLFLTLNIALIAYSLANVHI